MHVAAGGNPVHDFVPRPAPAALRARWLAEGLWNDDTFAALTAEGLAGNAGARARVLSTIRPFEGTIADLAEQGARLAGLLARRGIGPGDVVAFQLPNWAEAAACFYGLLHLGAVLVPIVHIYGHKEVGHILRQSEARGPDHGRPVRTAGLPREPRGAAGHAPGPRARDHR